MNRIGAAAGILVAMLATGCVPSVEEPEVWLTGTRVSALGLTGGTLEVRLGVYNPNRFGFEARGLTYDLKFEDPGRAEWVDFTAGRLEEKLRVGGRDTAEVVVPVEFTYQGLGGIVRQLIERGSFDYRVSGAVLLEEPVRREIPYRHAGRVTQYGAR